MSDCPGALAKLVLRKMHTKTSLMKLKFSAKKAVHDCYQCWKFELKISSDSGDMHFSAIKPRWGVCPPLRHGLDMICSSITATFSVLKSCFCWGAVLLIRHRIRKSDLESWLLQVRNEQWFLILRISHDFLYCTLIVRMTIYKRRYGWHNDVLFAVVNYCSDSKTLFHWRRRWSSKHLKRTNHLFVTHSVVCISLFLILFSTAVVLLESERTGGGRRRQPGKLEQIDALSDQDALSDKVLHCDAWYSVAMSDKVMH